MLRLVRRAVLVVAGIVVLVLAAAGATLFFRGARPAAVHAFGDPGGAPTAASAEFARTVELLAGVQLLPGNEVEPLLDGAGTFPVLLRDMAAARRSLTVQLYYIQPGVLLDSLAAVLAERARSGVRTHFLFDAFGAVVPDSTVRDLRRAGVRVARYRPIHWYTLRKAQNRSHARIVVIDGVVGYTGGFGVDDRWRGNGRSPEQWRETNVRFRGPAVARLQSAFVSAWAERTGELLAGELYFPLPEARAQPGPVPRAPSGIAGVLHALPTPGTTRAEVLFALTTAGARERLWITSAYFVPGPDVLAQLTAAARRGVDVRLLLPGRHTDVPLTRWAARAAYERLLASGVRIFEYGPSMMHAKTVVVDGTWYAIGSMNLDTRSFVHNEEVVLLGWDAGLGGRMEAIFRDDLRHAREITLEAFRRRGRPERLREGLARQLTRLL